MKLGTLRLPSHDLGPRAVRSMLFRRLSSFDRGTSSVLAGLSSVTARIFCFAPQCAGEAAGSGNRLCLVWRSSNDLTVACHNLEELARLLETTSEAVQDLHTGLRENISIVKDNMKSLEDKIAQAMAS
ncbi:unnamed protein product [Cladocopium goreaui]|uniref:Uncharacterized protein n=1 Tax=Cladocopium goreaui TaxID=2562237 RepID=A0A9P1BI15_9DINO|nr:unnamed protein product [Cladocopium goreaui]